MKLYEPSKPPQTPTKYGRCEECGYSLGGHDGFRCWRRTHCDCGAIAMEDDDFNKCCGECEEEVDACFCDAPGGMW